MIYFLRPKDTNFIKIGYTKFNDLGRINHFNAASPLQYDVILFIEGDIKKEKELHLKFKSDAVNGKNEWFAFSIEIQQFINDNVKHSVIPEVICKKRVSPKTNQIGVRFDKDMLDHMKEKGVADSPQKALNFLSNIYILTDMNVEYGSVQKLEITKESPVSSIHVPIDFSKVDHKKAMDSVKRSFQKTEDVAHEEVPINEEIQKQIELLIKERDNAPKDYSVVGKKVWRLDRQKKVDELQKQLK